LIDCVLVTCESVPDLDPDDRLLLDELRARDFAVAVGVWSDPNVDWSAARMCVLRSTWDYPGRYAEFEAWSERAARVSAFRNELRLVSWNAHKSYVRDLEQKGVPVVATIWLERGERAGLGETLKARNWEGLVIKPARGAASHNVMHVRRSRASIAAGQAHLDGLLQTQDVLIQPYLKSVATYGERALMFFDGAYSHAVVKKPFDKLLIVSADASVRVDPAEDEMAIAAKALASVPGRPLYARIDLLRDDDGNARVNEVELIEPGLYLAVHRPSIRVFADAIECELNSLT
jgi:hypothetical protein